MFILSFGFFPQFLKFLNLSFSFFFLTLLLHPPTKTFSVALNKSSRTFPWLALALRFEQDVISRGGKATNMYELCRVSPFLPDDLHVVWYLIFPALLSYRVAYYLHLIKKLEHGVLKVTADLKKKWNSNPNVLNCKAPTWLFPSFLLPVAANIRRNTTPSFATEKIGAAV